MLYWNNLMMLVATSANDEGDLGMTSAALDLSQLSGIAEEVVIAGTIHVALHLLDSTVAAIDLKC
jgi:hypothetical protein